MPGTYRTGGRNRKSAARHILLGNFRRDRHLPMTAEPEPPPCLSDAVPEELGTDLVAITAWTRTIVPLIQRGQITVADRDVAVAYCILWSTWRSQLAAAAKHDHVVAVGPHRLPRANPAQTAANKTYLLLVRTAGELGATPLARPRVAVAKRERALSAIDQFRAQKSAAGCRLRLRAGRVPKP